MTKLLLRLAINAAALWAAAELVDGIQLADSLGRVLVVALLFGVINTLIKPILQLFSLPFLILTLGLFTLVINALMLILTAALTSSLSVTGFGAAILGSLVISLVNVLMSGLVRDERAR